MTEETQTADTTEETTATAAPDSLLGGEEEKAMDFSQGRPEEFPEEFWDADNNTARVDDLFKSYQSEKKRAEGLRQKLSRGEFEGKVPENVDAYVLEIPEELKASVPDDDPLIAKAKEVALEAGLPVENFNKFMLPMIEAVNQLRADAEAAQPTEEELAAAREAEIAKVGANGKQMQQAVKGFLNNMVATGRLSQDELVTAQNMVYDAASLKLMNKIRTMIDPKAPPIQVPVDKASSRSEIEAKMAKAALSGDEEGFKKYSAMLHQAG